MLKRVVEEKFLKRVLRGSCLEGLLARVVEEKFLKRVLEGSC